jgi:hypothetical protein
MKSIRYVKAGVSFCHALFKGKLSNADPAAKQSAEKLWLSHLQGTRSAMGCPRFALFCFQGAHEGEVFFLTRQTTLLGTDASSSIVLTAAHANESAAYQIDLQSQPKLRSQGGSPFLLNGRPATQAEVFDYDELEILGNRFLVLDLFAESEANRGS